MKEERGKNYFSDNRVKRESRNEKKTKKKCVKLNGTILLYLYN